MAMTYQNFASLGVNLNRQKYGPLDISNVFTSAADLKYYLTKGTFTEGVSEYWYKNANEKVVPYPYEGQVLATVIDGVVSVYALSLDAEGNFQTQEIGAKIEVDGKTIKLNADGKLELVGIPADIVGKTLVPSLVNGELTWAEPDTSTAEGQAAEIEGLKTRATALEAAVNGTGEGDEHVAGLVEKVAALEAVDNATQAELNEYKEVVSAAIAAGVKEAKDYADAQDADTVYDDTDLQNRVAAIEGDYLKEADKYDDSEVRELISELDEAIGDTESGLVKDIADNKTAIETEAARAAAAEVALGQRIDAIDFVDEDELAEALEPINTALNTKAAQTDLEALQARVEAFLDNTGAATEAIDTLQELITYIESHDDADISGILASIQAIEDKLAGIDSTVAAYVAAAIEALNIGDYAKAADLTALAGRVEALEAKPFDTYAVKTEVEADIATAKSEAIADADAKIATKLASADFEAFKTENTAAIEAAQNAAIAAAKTETETQVGALEDAVAETYATKDELDEAVEGIENELLAYAKTADVNAELAKKIESGTIAHTSEGVTEDVTVEGTKLHIVVDAYTKEETLAKIDEKITSFTGGESAADVKNALDSYKETNNAKVSALEAKDEAHDTAIAEAKTLAQKGVDDAAAVAANLVTANAAIADNTREIGVAKSSIETVNTTLTEKVTKLEQADTKFDSDIVALTGIVSGDGGHASRITALEGRATNLETRDTELAALIQGNTDKFAGYYTKSEVDAAVQGAIDAIPDVDFTPYAKTEDVNAALVLKADADKVYTKEEANAEFMTESEVDARINALIAAADPEDGKVITDIQNLVKYVDENAGEIAGLVTTVGEHTTAIAKHTTKLGEIDAAIAAIVQPKASAEVTVAEDGTLGLGTVSTDKLVQGADTLVLNGGSAN